MQESRILGCSCARKSLDHVDRCSVCAQNRQKRMSQHSYGLPERPAKQLTPPPSQPSSPRRSFEMLAASPQPTRNNSASEIFTSAFTTESGSSCSLFPPSIYRHPHRSNGEGRRTSETPSSRSCSFATQSIPASEAASRKPSRSATPDARPFDNGYAPMAAGFARLSRNHGYSSSSSDPFCQGQAASARPSLDLGARMFSGPA